MKENKIFFAFAAEVNEPKPEKANHNNDPFPIRDF